MALIFQLFGLPASCTAIALLVVCRQRRPSECHANELHMCGLEVDFAHKIGFHGNVASEIEKK